MFRRAGFQLAQHHRLTDGANTHGRCERWPGAVLPASRWRGWRLCRPCLSLPGSTQSLLMNYSKRHTYLWWHLLENWDTFTWRRCGRPQIICVNKFAERQRNTSVRYFRESKRSPYMIMLRGANDKWPQDKMLMLTRYAHNTIKKKISSQPFYKL